MNVEINQWCEWKEYRIRRDEFQPELQDLGHNNKTRWTGKAHAIHRVAVRRAVNPEYLRLSWAKAAPTKTE